jgi:chemotaxis protein histidine kinase CheA
MDSCGAGAITVEQILNTLRGATEEQLASLNALLSRRTSGATSGPKKSVGRPRKEAVATVALPESDGDAPSADAYRLNEEDIDMSTCLGRKLAGGEDKRWKPVIYRESQCGSTVEDGCDLCKTCQRRLEKFVEEPKAGPWTGRVTEEPLGWVHMLGTEWAEEKKPKWVGGEASETGSVASAPSATSSKKSAEEKAAEKEAKKAEKAEAAAAKKAEKEAEKAAKKAEKEAEKAAAKAAKEAEKAAAKAEKEAAKAAKTPAKKAATPAKKAAAPAKAATETEAADAAGELKLIDGTLYMVRCGNVYEYDEISEKAGDFVGRLTADEGIDAEAEELTE